MRPFAVDKLEGHALTRSPEKHIKFSYVTDIALYLLCYTKQVVDGFK
jgi:hypothetical protein